MAQAAAHSKANRPKRLSTREFRAQAETLVERMIALMDEFDGDENLEDGADDEPSLLGYEGTSYAYDAEGDHCDQGEPELGWTGGMNQQHASDLLATSVWNGHGETEHDGREPDDDLEDGGDDEPGEGDLDASVGLR